MFRSGAADGHAQRGGQPGGHHRRLGHVLAKIPGSRIEKGVKDPLGRPAVGVVVNYPKTIPSGFKGKQEFFLDPTTYAYLGERLRGPDGGEITDARAASGVVDKPGRRP